MKNKKGFTLIELMVVIVLIATLAFLGALHFVPQIERGNVAEAVAMLSAIRQAEASYYLDNTVYTTDLTTGGPLSVDPSSSTKFAYTVDSAGMATATRNPPSGTCSGTQYANCNITLTMAGVWGGNHPFRPT